VRKLPLIAACLAAALAVSACGGGESDEEQIIGAVETSAISSNPADCTELATQAFLEQTEFEEGHDAVESCEESAEDTSDDADSISVSNVELNGSSATADAAIEGGSFNGQTVTIALVEEDDNWKLDEIESFVVFDRGKLLADFEEALEEEGEGSEDKVPSCILEELEGASEVQLEEAILSPEAFLSLASGCISA